MVSKESHDLITQLGDELLMRWATTADADELVVFNLRMHSEDLKDKPELWLKDWTRDILSGHHPTISPKGATVVVDPKKQNKIVSSMTMIPQLWAYVGLTFGCGRPELIAIDPDYRRAGLVRRQFEHFHTQSAAGGDLIQAITGIPWYYR